MAYRQREETMDRGVVHKSSAALVREMGEAGHGHGWWSMNNLIRPPFEQQHHPSLFMPSTTTTTGTAAAAVPSSSSSALHSFSSLLLSNHYPLPTTTSTSPPWQHDSTTTSSHGQQQDSWIQLLQYVISIHICVSGNKLIQECSLSLSKKKVNSRTQTQVVLDIGNKIILIKKLSGA